MVVVVVLGVEVLGSRSAATSSRARWEARGELRMAGGV